MNLKLKAYAPTYFSSSSIQSFFFVSILYHEVLVLGFLFSHPALCKTSKGSLFYFIFREKLVFVFLGRFQKNGKIQFTLYPLTNFDLIINIISLSLVFSLLSHNNLPTTIESRRRNSLANY